MKKMKRKAFLVLTMLALLICFLAISVSASSYGTDEEKLNKTVTVTLSDGSTKDVHIYNMMTDSSHGDFGKVLAITWYYDSNGELTWGYTNELISVSNNGVVTYSGISAQDVVVANFQCDVTHSDHGHGAIKSFGFTYYVNDNNANNNIQYVYMPDTLLELRTNMFRACPALKVCDFTTDSQLKTIGQYVFNRAGSLESIYIPSGVTSIPNGQGNGYGVFFNCTALKEVTFGDNAVIKSIGSSAFSGCTALTELIIPEGVTSIGDYCFRYCSNLSTVVLPDSVLTVGAHVFQHSGIVNSPFSVNSQCTSWGKYIFDHALSLENIIVPAGITTIVDSTDNGYGSFYGCTSLRVVTFAPNSKLEYVGFRAFGECTALAELVLPDSVTSLAQIAFYNAGLVNSPFSETSNCTSIGNSCFEGCKSLVSVNIPAGLVELPTNVFSKCSSLETVNFSDNSLLQVIGANAFTGCTSLVEINLPNTVTTLTNRTFVDCKALTSVTLPNSITTIGVRIFQGCSNLKRVNFGAGLTTLNTEGDRYSLTYQSGVNEVYLPATFTADSFANGGLTTYVFTNASTVFYYAGTQEQFDAIVAKLKGLEGNAAFNTVPTVENGRLVLVTSCEAFYNNEHEGSEAVVYENGYDNIGIHIVDCARCNQIIENELEPIIVSLGYSYGEYNATRTMISSGFYVNKDCVELYESVNNVTFEIGIMFALASSVQDEVPTNLDNIVHFNDDGDTVGLYEYIITFPSEDDANYDIYATAEFVASGFICIDNTYEFFQGNGEDAVVSTLESGFTTTNLNRIMSICTSDN